MRHLARTLVPAGLLLLAGCAIDPPSRVATGQTEAEVQARLGPPAARHVGGGGLARLEYTRAPSGRHTWMVDLDAQGRVAAVTQVLDERVFNRIVAGTPRAQLLAELGTPSARRPGGWQGGEIWSWRYDGPFCLWFMATMSEDGRVRDTGYGSDPVCEDLTTPS